MTADEADEITQRLQKLHEEHQEMMLRHYKNMRRVRNFFIIFFALLMLGFIFSITLALKGYYDWADYVWIPSNLFCLWMNVYCGVAAFRNGGRGFYKFVFLHILIGLFNLCMAVASYLHFSFMEWSSNYLHSILT